MNRVYEIMQGYKDVFVSSYRELLSRFMKMNNVWIKGRYLIEGQTHYFIETLENRLNNKDLMSKSWAMITSKVIHKRSNT
jgi:hypothetical protein